MTEKIFLPPKDFQERAIVRSEAEYKKLYEESVRDPEGFWAKMAGELAWARKWDKVSDCDFKKAKVSWFSGGKLNVSYNCLDRHLLTARKNKAALIWEPEDGEGRIFTYQDLHRRVCAFAGLLKSLGVAKGDRVAFYLPMIPELAIGMLACARIGAVHSVVFGGFSPASLKDRINDCGAKVLVTSDGSYRAGKVIPIKTNADQAMAGTPSIEKCIVVKRTRETVPMKEGRDVYMDDALSGLEAAYDGPVETDAEDPLFILYTSGSTGKPKGLLHTAGGYLAYVSSTMKYIFDLREEDTFWCTADIGWITGHSYIVYGPLSQGATSVMFEGVPTHPAPDRFWQVVEKYKVNTIYTAPTVIRSLMREGEGWTRTKDLSSLRLLGTVGEPINPEAWLWYHKNVGKGRCPVVDTWWQTETGGILISSLPGAVPLKPGVAGRPFFGIEPVVMKSGNQSAGEAQIGEEGALCIKSAWPGLARTIYGDPKRYFDTYFSQYSGLYYTGDGAKIDEDGDYQLLGRIDDVINVSGHRLGTAEIESALVGHPSVAESAVVGCPHEIKGQGIYAFVILKSGQTPSEKLTAELNTRVREEIGPIARPDFIQFTDGLPKTRSGKIMRRILRKIVEGKAEEIGDTTTLADSSVLEKLIQGRNKTGSKE